MEKYDILEISIRKANIDDLTAILELYAQPGMDDGKVLGLNEAERIFQRMSLYPDYCLYVACEGEHIIGSFALLIMDNLAHLGSASAIVEDVVIAPKDQKKGVGRKMMEFAMHQARKAGCYKLVLSSNKKRRNAHSFYERLGFEQHGYSFLVEITRE